MVSVTDLAEAGELAAIETMKPRVIRLMQIRFLMIFSSVAILHNKRHAAPRRILSIPSGLALKRWTTSS
jgi:hypothetical protein